MTPDHQPSEPPVDAPAVTELLRAIAEAGWDEARLVVDGTTLVYSRSSATPALGVTRSEPPAPPTPPAAPSQPDDAVAPAGREGPRSQVAEGPAPEADDAPPAEGVVVTAPSLGLFWRSPKPGAPPFVEVGDEVEPDTTVCIVEVMKLMNHVKAGVAGRVVAIHPANGDMVEYGTPLVTIEPS